MTETNDSLPGRSVLVNNSASLSFVCFIRLKTGEPNPYYAGHCSKMFIFDDKQARKYTHFHILKVLYLPLGLTLIQFLYASGL